MPECKSYTAKFKLTLITFAKKENRPAGREFSIDVTISAC